MRKVLNDFAEFDKEIVDKFLVLLSQVWLNSETANGDAESKERDKSVYEKARISEIAAIQTEIDRVKNANGPVLGKQIDKSSVLHNVVIFEFFVYEILMEPRHHP